MSQYKHSVPYLSNARILATKEHLSNKHCICFYISIIMYHVCIICNFNSNHFIKSPGCVKRHSYKIYPVVLLQL